MKQNRPGRAIRCVLRRFFLNANGHTDQRTDRPSYRDARTHLKMREAFEPWVSVGFLSCLFFLSGPIYLLCISLTLAVVSFLYQFFFYVHEGCRGGGPTHIVLLSCLMINPCSLYLSHLLSFCFCH